ncbi:hypothetical protein Baya_4247 [Bagarius yarrelli]|uniref:Uncharacterized protein n=1 Tax=Bagarius yarrelli TaxID=175774 RepID=A0A556TVU2_BAGYA|nr:hypothetical protein Baya_4247 [Bagarius yarrelli]
MNTLDVRHDVKKKVGEIPTQRPSVKRPAGVTRLHEQELNIGFEELPGGQTQELHPPCPKKECEKGESFSMTPQTEKPRPGCLVTRGNQTRCHSRLNLNVRGGKSRGSKSKEGAKKEVLTPAKDYARRDRADRGRSGGRSVLGWRDGLCACGCLGRLHWKQSASES